jgi:hypothetical protein
VGSDARRPKALGSIAEPRRDAGQTRVQGGAASLRRRFIPRYPADGVRYAIGAADSFVSHASNDTAKASPDPRANLACE